MGRQDGRIRAFGAVRADTGRGYSGGGSASELAKLDDLADGASFLLGHNLIAFDLPHLAAAQPGLRLLKLPAVDTLRLSPLAFPRNPYHHLIKHYQDGGLKQGRVNDPELDSRLALEVFGDQQRALKGTASDLLTAWHWLTTLESKVLDRALDDFFSKLRDARRPADAEARLAMGPPAGRHGLRESGARGLEQGERLRLGTRLHAGMAVGSGRQLGDAALGAASVSGSGADWCAGSGTPPAPTPGAAGAGSGTMPARS